MIGVKQKKFIFPNKVSDLVTLDGWLSVHFAHAHKVTSEMNYGHLATKRSLLATNHQQRDKLE